MAESRYQLHVDAGATTSLQLVDGFGAELARGYGRLLAAVAPGRMVVRWTDENGSGSQTVVVGDHDVRVDLAPPAEVVAAGIRTVDTADLGPGIDIRLRPEAARAVSLTQVDVFAADLHLHNFERIGMGAWRATLPPGRAWLRWWRHHVDHGRVVPWTIPLWLPIGTHLYAETQVDAGHPSLTRISLALLPTAAVRTWSADADLHREVEYQLSRQRARLPASGVRLPPSLAAGRVGDILGAALLLDACVASDAPLDGPFDTAFASLVAASPDSPDVRVLQRRVAERRGTASLMAPEEDAPTLGSLARWLHDAQARSGGVVVPGSAADRALARQVGWGPWLIAEAGSLLPPHPDADRRVERAFAELRARASTPLDPEADYAVRRDVAEGAGLPTAYVTEYFLRSPTPG